MGTGEQIGTIFIDLDGTIVEHNYTPFLDNDNIIEDAIDKLYEWREKGYYIVLTTHRDIDDCKFILKRFVFDKIITNLPTGKRILINDDKYDDEPKAEAIRVKRNQGISHIKL